MWHCKGLKITVSSLWSRSLNYFKEKKKKKKLLQKGLWAFGNQSQSSNVFEIFVLTFDRQNKDEGKKPEVKKVEKKRG